MKGSHIASDVSQLLLARAPNLFHVVEHLFNRRPSLPLRASRLVHSAIFTTLASAGFR